VSQLRTHPLRFASGTVVYHLMRADLFERARRYSFLITLGFVVFAAYLYIPPKEADDLTLGLGNYRGVYNSAWVGGAMAVLSSTLLSLPAFYLVKNAIERFDPAHRRGGMTKIPYALLQIFGEYNLSCRCLDDL
jgi:hypothetical protein